MMMHTPVLLVESVQQLLQDDLNGCYCDVTYGRGGHSQQILKQLNTQGFLYALDQDPEAAQHAKKQFMGVPNAQFIAGNFADLAQLLPTPKPKLDGLLADLGVSSPQYDEAHRGFSFQKRGPLDMRMNPKIGVSAAQWLQQQSVSQIRYCLQAYGDVSNAGRWSKLIKKAADAGQLQTTTQLSELVLQHTSFKRQQHMLKHPATQIFQAIRIAINDELTAMQRLLDSSLQLLKQTGRLVVISFHSLEHRLLRQFSRKTNPENPPPGLPIEVKPLWQVRQLLVFPPAAEIQQNPRARSARLTVLQRL